MSPRFSNTELFQEPANPDDIPEYVDQPYEPIDQDGKPYGFAWLHNPSVPAPSTRYLSAETLEARYADRAARYPAARAENTTSEKVVSDQPKLTRPLGKAAGLLSVIINRS